MKHSISVEGISKQYTLGSEAEVNQSFREMVLSSLTAPFRRLSRLQGSASDQERFWALRDISFDVAAGDVVGIIGRNGAGKSTLLKILSRITTPTEGRIRYHGRMASLLEVGTGFHPELTGRENIYLNGAILGMTRAEITLRMDEIVEFAGVEKFLDTPVKRFSSGMYVRLAFAVAAHLDPDILIVDEVLSVGDAKFQNKCIGKMSEVATEGRTVLFVSHNLAAVRKMCTSIKLLDQGRLVFEGSVADGLAVYEESIGSHYDSVKEAVFKGPLRDVLRFESLRFMQDGAEVTTVQSDQELTIELRGVSDKTFEMIDINIQLYRDGEHLASIYDSQSRSSLASGSLRSDFVFRADTFTSGRYTIAIGAVDLNSNDWVWGGEVAVLNAVSTANAEESDRNLGLVNLAYRAERYHSE